jgi:hypothetical protein
MKEFVIYRPDILKRVAIFGAIGLVVLIFFSIKWNNTYLNYQFNGRLDSIAYGDKGTPIVIIKGKTYFLKEVDWNFHKSHIIQKGDSLIKDKNSITVKLVKPNGEVIIK